MTTPSNLSFVFSILNDIGEIIYSTLCAVDDFDSKS